MTEPEERRIGPLRFQWFPDGQDSGNGAIRISTAYSWSNLQATRDDWDAFTATRLSYYSERNLRARAERVIAGTEGGGYKKSDLARDILKLLDRIGRMRTDAVAADLTRERPLTDEAKGTVRSPPRARLRRDVPLEGGVTVPEGTLVEVWSQKGGALGVFWADEEGNHAAAFDAEWLEMLP